ncbi:IS5 family transposase ISSsv1 [Streptomyces alboniger]
MSDGYGIPLGRVLAGANRHDSPRIGHKGEKTPIQASRRWHVERTHAWQNAFHRLARCYKRRVTVIDAFFDLADTIITVRSLIRRSWTTRRWDERPNRRP